ncbi:ECF transporter S component [Soehngenia saccharolytica]|nr:ECF transporter S component [Soehngenia saccharolytica]
MKNKNSILIISALAVAINIVLGTLVSRLQIPLLFLDTLGTIFIAALYGPWYGASVGAITNILTPILSGNPKDIPFFIVNAAIGLIVGIIAKKYKFGTKQAIITGIILAIVAPLIGTPIAVYVYGGLTGSGNDIIFSILKQSGAEVFTAAFIPRIAGNLIDKILSCLLASYMIKRLPKEYIRGDNI